MSIEQSWPIKYSKHTHLQPSITSAWQLPRSSQGFCDAQISDGVWEGVRLTRVAVGATGEGEKLTVVVCACLVTIWQAMEDDDEDIGDEIDKETEAEA